MTAKQRVLQVLEALPDDATLLEIVEELQHLDSAGSTACAEQERPLAEGGAWDLLEQAAGTVEMPADWANEHDHYLYGTPKRSSAA